MLDLEERGLHVGPSFIGYKHPFATPIQDRGFVIHFQIELKTYSFKQKPKEEPKEKEQKKISTLTPNSSRLSTCQAQILELFFTWPIELPFKTHEFKHMWPLPFNDLIEI